jgi:hypothetical protein
MAEETIESILSELKRIKKVKPTIDYFTYWKEVEAAIKSENEIFIKEDEKLVMSDDAMHRYFSL